MTYTIHDVNRVANSLWLQAQEHPGCTFECDWCTTTLDPTYDPSFQDRQEFAKHVLFFHGVMGGINRVDRVLIPLGLPT